MKISPIRNIAFKSAEPIITGFDDTVSEARRDSIREHFMSEYMPKPETYSGRLSDFEMNKLLNSMLKYNEPKYVDNDIMSSLPMRNIQKLAGLNAYRGEAPIRYSDWVYKKMKNAGIDRIINLTGFRLGDTPKKYGIECFDYDMDYIYGSKISEMFLDKEDVVKKVQRNFGGLDNISLNEYIKEALDLHEKNLEAELSRFVEFIKFMQKDNYYIGCEFGTYCTNNALLLNRFFNPGKTAPVRGTDRYSDHFIRANFLKLYNNLKPQHKKAMGWSNNFNEELGNKLIALVKEHH